MKNQIKRGLKQILPTSYQLWLQCFSSLHLTCSLQGNLAFQKVMLLESWIPGPNIEES